LPWGRWNSTEAAEDGEDRVDEEDELAAGAQQAGGLRDPEVGVAPDARAVLGDRDVEGFVGVGDLLGVAVEEREVEAELLLVAAGGGELGFAVVDANRAGAAAGEPGGDVAGAAAELDRVAAVELLGEEADFGLGQGEDAPGRFLAFPVEAARIDVVVGQPVPVSPVAGYVFGEVRVCHAPSLGRRERWYSRPRRGRASGKQP